MNKTYEENLFEIEYFYLEQKNSYNVKNKKYKFRQQNFPLSFLRWRQKQQNIILDENHLCPQSKGRVYRLSRNLIWALFIKLDTDLRILRNAP